MATSPNAHPQAPVVPEIEHGDQGSILNPFKALSFFGRSPVTQPLVHREASANYRGFHVNDWELCIGCGTCQKVCDNAAISMVKVPGLPDDPVKGVRPERPAIDYGRCCWCALCVDICPTGSISCTKEYVHTCTEAELDSYFILPDPKGIHDRYYDKGWDKSTDNDLLDLGRQPMTELAPEARLGGFDEIVAGYRGQEAIFEASRCVQCGMCHDSCPTHMDAPGYIRAIWQGDLERAVADIYETNPFSHVCGRVCTHRCETACSIGRRGDPVAIRWLKRYALDTVGHEAVKRIAARGKATESTGRKVAVIGAGPAGLTAAFDLVKKGHQVVVFEALDKPGGMTRYGIPEYRLPYDKLDQDVEVITSLGVEIRYNTPVGRDVTLPRLEQEYDAVVLAIGLQKGRSTRIPGSDHAAVHSAVSLLRKITRREDFPIPRRAVVIGGGNVAMDIARSLARLQRRDYGQVDMIVTGLESLENFKADVEEIKEAQEEGVSILDRRGPTECALDENGNLLGLRTLRVLSVFDDQGRFHPKYDAEDAQLHGADMVIEAIGQMADTRLLGEELTERLEWNRGRLKVDAAGRTSEPWLWAGGDAVNGPDVVHAVADGHRTAADIHAYLTQEEVVAV